MNAKEFCARCPQREACKTRTWWRFGEPHNCTRSAEYRKTQCICGGTGREHDNDAWQNTPCACVEERMSE